MFEFKETELAGVFEIHLPFHPDDRGSFQKVFQKDLFQKQGLDFDLHESYFSFSQKGVIRGMHFQLPPHEHHKIVYCPVGSIRDVVVDLRKDSGTYGQYIQRTLSSAGHTALYIPKGCAHGFQTLQAGSMTVYLVSSEYQKNADTGIRWDSFGLDWEVTHPIISERDRNFIALADFESPF